MRERRERGLVTFQSQGLAIHDRDGLVELADFDPFYLFLGGQAH